MKTEQLVPRGGHLAPEEILARFRRAFAVYTDAEKGADYARQRLERFQCTGAGIFRMLNSTKEDVLAKAMAAIPRTVYVELYDGSVNASTHIVPEEFLFFTYDENDAGTSALVRKAAAALGYEVHAVD